MEELISQSMHYKPLFTMCRGRERAKLQSSKIMFYHQTSVKYMHSIKRLLEEMISKSVQNQSLLNINSGRELA